jgi:hypothetical protein
VQAAAKLPPSVKAEHPIRSKCYGVTLNKAASATPLLRAAYMWASVV